jgi:heptosyltransferase-1
MKILIVRTSSLGDLIHMLPAISDIKKHHPDATIDWVVEEAFTEIPHWHAAIHRVIVVAHRRWRRSWWSDRSKAERQAALDQLRSVSYDLVLDMQGLMKSVWLVKAAHGVKHGLSWLSTREPLCAFLYDHRHLVKIWQPAVTRQRQLAAMALGYTPEGPPDFGLEHLIASNPNTDCADPSDDTTYAAYAVIMPSASRDNKLWPSEDWQAVFDRLQGAGLALRLLAGNDAERQRAQQLIGSRPNTTLQPKSSLTELAALISGARLMVGLDSGLTHLSAAVGTDTIGIYKASTPARTPLVGRGFVASLGDKGCPPDRAEVLAAIDTALSSSTQI